VALTWNDAKRGWSEALSGRPVALDRTRRTRQVTQVPGAPHPLVVGLDTRSRVRVEGAVEGSKRDSGG
jgi:hypothetical protein